MNFFLSVVLLLLNFIKISLKNFNFSNNYLFILENFWKQHSYSSIFRRKNFFMTEFIDSSASIFFRQEFINLYFSLKKKIFFKRRKFFLSRFKSKKLKTLSKSLLKNKENNKIFLKIIKKVWYSNEFKFSKNWMLKMFIQKKIKNQFFLTNFLKSWTILVHWKKFQKFHIFNTFKIKHLKKRNIKTNSFLIFLNFYIKNYKKILDSKVKKIKLKQYRFKKLRFYRKFKSSSSSLLYFFPRKYRNFLNKFESFPKRLQYLFSPYKITLQKNYLDLLDFLKKKYLLNDLKDLDKNENLIKYFLKFKKKRSNFYFTIFNNRGEVIYYLSSGRFSKLNFQKRNRKMRNSLFSLGLIIKTICKVLKKKKIYKIHVFLKPSALKFYIIRRIFFNFYYSGVKLLSIKNLISFSHNCFLKNKKIRRI